MADEAPLDTRGPHVVGGRNTAGSLGSTALVLVLAQGSLKVSPASGSPRDEMHFHPNREERVHEGVAAG